MKLTADRNFQDVGIEGRFQRSTGEEYDVSTNSAENRQRIFETLSAGQAHPSNYKAIVEVTIQRGYHIFENQSGQWFTGSAGETRDLPRGVALHLVCINFARPTDKTLWFYDPPEPVAEEKIRILHNQSERAATAAAESKADSFVQRWGNKWRS